jgi:4-hydroxybenzoyl-CoA thioesterase
MKRLIEPRLVNFADCDPAQLVFYPRYFEWFDRNTEQLFRSAGLHWQEMYATNPDWNGVPILDAGANFKRPCRFGDTVEIETWVEEWRGKTFLVRHHIRNRGELAVEGHELRVWAIKDKTRPAGLRAEPVPPDIVARFQE